MKKVLLICLLFCLSSKLFSLSDLEKYNLFYSATDIVFMVPLQDEKTPENIENNKFLTRSIEKIWNSFWTGNNNAKIICFDDNYDGDIDVIKRKSKKIFKDFDENNTLIVLPDKNCGNSILFLNSNKKAELLLRTNQPPDGYFSGSYSSPTDSNSVMMSLNNLRTRVNLLQYPKEDRDEKKLINLSLKRLKNETIFFNSNLFDTNDSKYLSIDEFREIYPYKAEFSNFFETIWNPNSLGDPKETREIMRKVMSEKLINDKKLNNIIRDTSISIITYSIDNNAFASPSANGPYGVALAYRYIFIYDKTNEIIINLTHLQTKLRRKDYANKSETQRLVDKYVFFSERDILKLINEINQ